MPPLITRRNQYTRIRPWLIAAALAGAALLLCTACATPTENACVIENTQPLAGGGSYTVKIYPALSFGQTCKSVGGHR